MWWLVFIYLVGIPVWFVVYVRSSSFRQWTHEDDAFKSGAADALGSALFWPVFLFSLVLMFVVLTPIFLFRLVASELARLVLRGRS